MFATGRGPSSLAPWLAGAPITPLRKDDNGITTITVGKSIGRLLGLMLPRRSTNEINEYIAPIQLLVATKGGIEAIIHDTREITTQYRDNKSMALLQIDLINAFNHIPQALSIREMRMKFPKMFRWVQYCYGENKKPHLCEATVDFSVSAEPTQAMQPILVYLNNK